MSAFTAVELDYLSSQSLARLATASLNGEPDVSAVGFTLDGSDIVSGGLDLTKTVRYRHLKSNPRATVVVDDLASVEPFRPRGIKVKGDATVEEHNKALRVRIRPLTIWSWGLNVGATTYFAGSVEKRQVSPE